MMLGPPPDRIDYSHAQGDAHDDGEHLQRFKTRTKKNRWERNQHNHKKAEAGVQTPTITIVLVQGKSFCIHRCHLLAKTI